MDQHRLDLKLASESDLNLPVDSAPAGARLPAGHAWFVMDDDDADQVTLLGCGARELLGTLLQHVKFSLRARSITVMIDKVVVPVIVVLLRIQGSDEPAYFSAWVNE